jgi:hypothetical protein
MKDESLSKQPLVCKDELIRPPSIPSQYMNWSDPKSPSTKSPVATLMSGRVSELGLGKSILYVEPFQPSP